MGSHHDTPARTRRILVVDDDARLCRLLQRYLQRDGYVVHAANSGAGMRRQMKIQPPDLVLLDLMLPDEDGLNLAREIAATSGAAIIMLTAKDEPIDRVVGLELGADDYVCKPFDQRELLARIRSVLRRVGSPGPVGGGAAGGEEIVASFPGWRMNISRLELTRSDGERVDLTTHEFRLLEVLVRRALHVVSRDEILQVLSGREWEPDSRSVDVLVGRLRRKIEREPGRPRLIRTVRAAGYQFTAKVRFEG